MIGRQAMLRLRVPWLLPIAIFAGPVFVVEAHGQEPMVFKTEGPVDTFAFSHDGRYLAAAVGIGYKEDGSGNTVMVWDLMTGKPFRLLEPHSTHVQGLAWTPDSAKLVAVNRKGSTVVVTPWNVKSAEAGVRTVLPQVGGFLGLSNDGKHLVMGFGDNKKLAHVWDVEHGKEVANIEAGADATSIVCAVFSPDGKTLVTATRNGWIKWWSVPAFEQKAEIKLEKGTVDVLYVGASADFVVCRGWADYGGLVCHFDGKKVKSTMLKSGVPLALSPDGKTLATYSDRPIDAYNAVKGATEGYLHLWDMVGGKATAYFVNKEKPNLLYPCTRFSPDGRFLAVQLGTRIELLQVADFQKPKPPNK
jgi:WD40 repeat protein